MVDGDPEGFGGQDTNFNCTPDYHWTKCPHYITYQTRAGGDCVLIEKPLSSGNCDFTGSDYRTCPFFTKQIEDSSALQRALDHSGDIFPDDDPCTIVRGYD